MREGPCLWGRALSVGTKPCPRARQACVTLSSSGSCFGARQGHEMRAPRHGGGPRGGLLPILPRRRGVSKDDFSGKEAHKLNKQSRK